jgi:hypothetical protein
MKAKGLPWRIKVKASIEPVVFMQGSAAREGAVLAELADLSAAFPSECRTEPQAWDRWKTASHHCASPTPMLGGDHHAFRLGTAFAPCFESELERLFPSSLLLRRKCRCPTEWSTRGTSCDRRLTIHGCTPRTHDLGFVPLPMSLQASNPC